MKHTKQLAFAIAACFTVVSLAGCASSGTSDNATPPAPTVEHYYDNNISEVHKTLEDGRTIVCILYDGYKQGGLSCDWNPPAK